jgi:hypothetical protein
MSRVLQAVWNKLKRSSRCWTDKAASKDPCMKYLMPAVFDVVVKTNLRSCPVVVTCSNDNAFPVV